MENLQIDQLDEAERVKIYGMCSSTLFSTTGCPPMPPPLPPPPALSTHNIRRGGGEVLILLSTWA